MKKNIYISYINSDSMNFKNKIIDRFKGRKYKFSDESYDVIGTPAAITEDEKLKLAKKISVTDVTIVLISRNVLESKWIPLEIQYSLDLTSQLQYHTTPKGVIGVVIPDKGNDYSYMMSKGRKGIWGADKTKLPEIISANTLNEKVLQNKNNVNYDSYISIYRWEDFIRDFENCVNIANAKATIYFDDYIIKK